MAKNTRSKKKTASFSWATLFMGVIIGVTSTLLIFLKDEMPSFVDNKSVDDDKRAAAKKQLKMEPVFEFYTLLPETETIVGVPKDEQKPIVTTPRQQQKTKKEANKARYIVQAGSFKKLTDADSLKARLAFMGIKSNIQKVTIDNKDTWHRVQIGPIIGRQQVDELQKKLKQNNIVPLLMRAKNS